MMISEDRVIVYILVNLILGESVEGDGVRRIGNFRGSGSQGVDGDSRG